MADPRINYDIAANVTGGDDVAALASQLDKLAAKLDGDLKTSAESASKALRDLTSKQAAVDNFVALKASAAAAAEKLAELQAKAQAAAIAIAQSDAPTRAQQGQLLKLRDAVRAAKDELTQQNAALDRSRAALSGYGIDTKSLASEQVKLNAELKSAQAGATQAATQIREQAAASKTAATATSSHASMLGELKNAASAYIGVNLVKDFFDTAAAQEANRKALDQLTGSTQAGAKEMDYLRGVADRLGIKIDDAARAYVSLSASTAGTNLAGQNTRAIFEAVAGAMAKLGKSSADTERALAAVGQMASKGTVSMEELRGQLGESLPGAMQAAARAMGVTVAELDKMVSSGTLTADELLPKLADELNKTFGSAPPDTLNASMAQLQNTVTNTYAAMADSGGADVMRSSLQGLQGIFAALADIANSAMQAFILFGKTLGITASAIAQVLRGDLSGAAKTWATEMDAATLQAAEGVEKVRKAVGLLPTDAEQAGAQTSAAMAAPKSAAEQLAESFTKAGGAATSAGTQSAAAASGIAQNFGPQTRQGVLDLANAFVFAGDKADAMQANVAASIRQMSTQDLAGMAQALKDAYQAGEIDAQNLSRINTMVLGESFTRLGMDAQAAMGGISAKTGEAIAGVDALSAALQSAGQTGPAAAQAIGAALSQALNRADTQAGLDAIVARINDMRGLLGDKITDGLLDQAADKARALKSALDDAVPGINGVEEAMRKLGVTSDATLKATADSSKAAYDALAQSGQASARELSAAFAKAAQDAIAANGGVAPSWVEAQAAVRGYSVETGKAGDAVKRLADTTSAATSSMSAGFGNVTTSVQQTTQQIEQLRQRQQQVQQDLLRRYGRPGEGTPDINSPDRTSTRGEKMAPGVQEIGTGGYQFRNSEGMASDAKGNTISQFSWTYRSVVDYLTQAGLDPLLAQRLAKQFVDQQGNVPYTAGGAQLKWGGQYSTLAQALGKMADYYQYTNAGKIEAQQMLSWEQANQPGAKKPTPAPAPGQPPSPAPAPAPAQAIDRVVNLYIGPYNNPYGIPTNATGQAALQRMASDIVDTLQTSRSQALA